jgi:hypothetical protein
MHYSFNANAGTITFKARVKANTKGFCRLILLPTTFDSNNQMRVNLATGAIVDNQGLTGTQVVAPETAIGTSPSWALRSRRGNISSSSRRMLTRPRTAIWARWASSQFVRLGLPRQPPRRKTTSAWALSVLTARSTPASVDLAVTITRMVNDLKTRSLGCASSAIDPINEPDRSIGGSAVPDTACDQCRGHGGLHGTIFH